MTLNDGSGQDWLNETTVSNEDAAYAAEYDYDTVIAERNTLRGENNRLRAELKARSCETCAWHIDRSTECKQDVLIPVGMPTNEFWCSLWKLEEVEIRGDDDSVYLQ